MLNPDKNLFSVAPVGHIVIIGRNGALKGGLSRKQAINLLAWLTISTGASPDEIAAEIEDANNLTVMSPAPRLPKKEVPRPAIAATIRPGQPPVENVQAFIGEIDSEEQAAIDAAMTGETKRTALAVDKAPKVEPVDIDKLKKSWGGNNA